MATHLIGLSGGLDSTVLCASLLAEHGPGSVCAVFFQYGSKHGPLEEQAARRVAGHFDVELIPVDLQPIFSHATSALLAADARAIPKEPYDTASMRQTVVPGRNLMFASVLACIAESRGIARIALATHAGDHALYPDCRPAFNAALERVIAASSDGTVQTMTPFSQKAKADIVALGASLPAPFTAPFALTRSCYEETEHSCGRCGTCRERLEAFAANGLRDPVSYSE